MITAYTVQVLRRRKHGRMPEALIPATAGDPRARRRAARRLGNLVQNLALAQSSKIQLFQLLADTFHVNMSVSKTRKSNAIESYSLSTAPSEGLNRCLRTNRNDPSCRYGHRPGLRMGRIERQEVADKNGIGFG